MENIEKPYTFDRVVRIIITLIVIGLMLLVLNYLREVLIPFVVALIFAYLMNPLVNFIQRFVKKRVIAVFSSLLLLMGVFTLLGVIMIPLIIKEVAHMSELIQDLVVKSDLQQQIQSYLPDNLSLAVHDFISNQDFQQLFNIENAGGISEFVIQKFLPTIGSIFSETLSFILGIFGLAIIILYLIFLLIDYNDVIAEWKSLIPPKYKNVILGVVHDFEEAMNNYFRAQALIASIVGVLFAIGFSIIGLPMGILLGLFTGVLNMMPYLHNLSLIPALFLAMMKSLETGSDMWIMFALVLVVFGVVQIIADVILVPKIMGNATGLNAAVILLSLSIWGKMLGMLGLLIALPMTYLLLSYYRRFLSKYQKVQGPERPAPESKKLKYRTVDK